MRTVPARACSILLLFLLTINVAVLAHAADDPPLIGLGFVVQDFYGGAILGYDIDRLGTEGMLSEYVELSNGSLLIATETFDQATGRITAVVEAKVNTMDNFVTAGVVGNHTGLREWEHVQGLRVTSRTYNVMNPLQGNRFTGLWLPPINNNTQLFEDIEGDQGNPNAAVMISNQQCCGRAVFGSNVAANRFGPVITLQDPLFTQGVPPQIAYWSAANQAVLSQSQGAPFTIPQVMLVDLATRTIVEFTGQGGGYVNGLAVDSSTGIACTTTETDNAAEFYNLANHTGFRIFLPNIGLYSATSVANDPIHKLFLIGHPVPSAPGQIHIYDENGNLINSITNVFLGPGGFKLVINPSTRTGFVLARGRGNNFSGLQQFTY